MANLFRHIMLEAYNDKMAAGRVKTFLLNFFGKTPQEIVVAETEKVDIDIIRDNRIVAADVLRGSGAGNKNVVGKFTAKEYAVPLYWEEGPITAAMLNKRLPGIDPFTESGHMEALAFWAAQLQVDNTNKILRAMEKMSAEALQSGTISLKNQESLNFKKKSTHTVTPSTKWDASGGDPLSDIKGLCTVIFQDGKHKPETAIFGSAAWSAFVGNSSVTDYLDKRLIEPGRIAPSEYRDGATYQGRLWIGDYQLDLYTYQEFYESSGTATPYISEDTVILMNSKARLTKAFGAVEVLPQFENEYREQGMPPLPEFKPGEFIPFLYPLPPSGLMAGVQSAPVVVPTAIDTIGTLVNVDS